MGTNNNDENTIFILKKLTIHKKDYDKYKVEIINVFFNKKDTLKYIIKIIKDKKGKPINPYKKNKHLREYVSDSSLLFLEYKKRFECYYVDLKHDPIPDIMKSWCDYTTLVKINAYTYPDYFNYFKGNLEDVTGIEF